MFVGRLVRVGIENGALATIALGREFATNLRLVFRSWPSRKYADPLDVGLPQYIYLPGESTACGTHGPGVVIPCIHVLRYSAVAIRTG